MSAVSRSDSDVAEIDTLGIRDADFDCTEYDASTDSDQSQGQIDVSAGLQSELDTNTADVPHPPASTRLRTSTSRQPPPKDDSILTYDEEILLLRSAKIIKKLKGCTEQCKDVITIIRFCIQLQPDLEYNAKEICHTTKDCNTSLKALLVTIEPLHNNKKAAEIIVADLDILLHGLQASMNIFQTEFDLFDITPRSPGSREMMWKHTLDKFEKDYYCSMLENLDLVQRFGKEVTANFKIGVFKSPESTLLKKRLAQASGYKDLPISPTLETISDELKFSANLRPSVLQSPSRYVQSPSRSSWRGSPISQPIRVLGHRSKAIEMDADQPTTAEDPHATSNITYRPQNGNDSSGDDSDSSDRTLTSPISKVTGEVSWLWIFQADVLPGYFATPWKSLISSATCTGAISVFLKSTEEFTSESNLRYVASHAYCTEWLLLGKTTYPSYAHDADGGVVVAGAYESVIFDAFKSATAPLEILGSYEFQVDRNYYARTQTVLDSTAELMGLDSWLSICGRVPEIAKGPSRLLQSLPTLIQQIMMDFDLEFSSVDRTSRDGASRIIKTIAGSLLQYLNEQGLSKAEQLFALVALLRTAKMGLCIARGMDTAKLHDVLVHDVQVYLA